MVYSNGKVGACACRDFEASSELILGNVADQSLEEMVERPKARIHSLELAYQEPGARHLQVLPSLFVLVIELQCDRRNHSKL